MFGNPDGAGPENFGATNEQAAHGPHKAEDSGPWYSFCRTTVSHTRQKLYHDLIGGQVKL
jgi:hypothetical protein